MKSYELTYLISPDISDEDLKVFQEKISSLIREEEGIIQKESPPAKKRLGYPIRKKEIVYLATVNFRINPGEISEIEKKLKAQPQIFRYILFSRKEEVLQRIGKRIFEKKIKVSPKPSIKPEKKVALKEIDKKLEEILGE